MRVDLYKFVHKAQRYELFQFGQLLSRADLSQEPRRVELGVAVHAILRQLRDHAHNEEAYIHPLFDKLGSEGARIADEHVALDESLAELAAIVDQGRSEELYSSYMRFLGQYLLHIDFEERAQAQVLWPNLSDADLGAVFIRFKAERAPAVAKADLEHMLPALSVPELTQMFRGMKAGAPAPVFQASVDVAQRVLGSARWAEVALGLG